MKKFFTALAICAAFGVNVNFVEAADKIEVVADDAKNFQELDFWSRLRDEVVFGDSEKDDRYRDRPHHRHEPPPPPPPRYRDDGRRPPHRHEPPPPPPGHRPPPPRR